MPTIISRDTVWRSGQVIDLADTVQIAAGATLTIEAGAIVNGNGHQISAFGKLVVAGNEQSKVDLNNVRLQFGTSYSVPGRIEIDHAKISGGGFLPASGNGAYGSFSLTNSFLTETEPAYIWYPSEESRISGNVFYNAGGLGIGTRVAVSVTDNVFLNTTGGVNGTAAVVSWAAYGPAVDVTRNTFLGTDAALEVTIDGKMSAADNYFGTLNRGIIQNMILDQRDDLNRPSVIPFDPPASGPSAVAAQALADSGLPFIVGTAQGEQLTGTSGSDTIYGGDGDDRIEDGRGSDTIYAGAGNDHVFISRSDNGATETLYIDAGTGNDTVTYQNYSAGSATILLGAGDDRLNVWTVQSDGLNVALGAGSDTVYLAQALSLNGLLSITDFAVGTGGDMLDLTDYYSANLLGWDGSANPFGSAGYLRLVQSGNATLLQMDSDGIGGTAHDFTTLIRFGRVTPDQFTAYNLGGFNRDGSAVAGLTITGTDGPDTLTGTAGADTIAGGDGADTLDGGAGNDVIDGGAGNDTIQGGTGNDVISGGDGDDSIADIGGSDTIDAGRGDDRIFISRGDNATTEHVVIDAGEGNETVTYQNYRSGSLVADLGSGDDNITLWTVQDGGARLTLGAGRDTITLSSLIDIHQYGTLQVTDFETGTSGDRLDLQEYINRALTGWNGSANPFGPAGYLRLIQLEGTTLLQIDKDGAAGTAHGFQNLASFEGAAASAFVADNFLPGFAPSFVNAADIATAYVSAPASIREGETASLSITLKNVRAASGTVYFSFDAMGSTANGTDVSVPAYQGSFAVSKSPAGDYRIDLPSITALQDALIEPTETIALRVRVTGQTFANGTDETIVRIALRDGDQIGSAGNDTIIGSLDNNVVRGMAGDDVIRTLGGRDVVDGGAGFDTLELSGLLSDYQVLQTSGRTFLVDGKDAVDVANIEQVRFGNGAAIGWADVLSGAEAFDGLSYIASHRDLINVFGANAEAGNRHFAVAGFAEGRTASFDPLAYTASYADLRQVFGTDEQASASHYIQTGVTEGRSVSFNGYTYIASYADLRAAFGTDADTGTRHFIESGATEGRSVTFDAYSYLATNTEVLRQVGADISAAAVHYITTGASQGLATSGFAALRYTASYDDLIQVFGTDTAAATQHYVVAGAFEGREATFNALGYIASYTDLRGAFGTDEEAATRHYIQSGFGEERAVTFNALNYVASYSDLIQVFGIEEDTAARHYIRQGAAEGREVSFDPLAYAAANPDVAAVFGDNQEALARHYIQVGFAEGRAVDVDAAGAPPFVMSEAPIALPIIEGLF